MEEKGVGLELLTKVRSNLEHMKARLDLLRKARDRVRKGIRRNEGRVQDRVREAKIKENVLGAVRPIEEEIQEGGLISGRQSRRR